MRKFFSVIIAVIVALTASAASALSVDTGKGRPNIVISDGVAYAIPLAKICGMKTLRAGPARYDVGRNGKYVTIGGLTTQIVCLPAGSGGGSTATASTAGKTPKDRVEAVYGEGVDYTNDTHTATAGNGGQQTAGDDVPSRDVEQDQFGGEAASSGEHQTANGNEAPSF